MAWRAKLYIYADGVDNDGDGKVDENIDEGIDERAKIIVIL